MNMPSPLCIVCFPEKHTNMIPLEDKRVLVHPRRVSRATAPFSSWLLQRGWERESQPGRCAQTALDAEEGGREAGREKTERNFFFPPLDKSCSHMGGTRLSDLTEGWLEWSQWSVQSGGVTLSNRQQPSRPACRRRASVNETGRKWVPPLSTIASKAFPLWSTWASTSAALWSYKPSEM